MLVVNADAVTRSPKQQVDEWLVDHQMTRTDLALRLKISTAHLSMILSGERTPSLDVAVALERLTGIPPKTFAGVGR